MEKLSDLQPGDLTCAGVAPCIPYCVGHGLWVCVTSEEGQLWVWGCILGRRWLELFLLETLRQPEW